MSLRFYIYLLIITIISSCIPNWNKPDEIQNLENGTKEWIVGDSAMFHYKMTGLGLDTFLFAESFSQFSISGSASKVENFNAYVVQGEHFDQFFTLNNLNDQYWISLKTAEEEDHGDLFSIFLLGSEWAYDFTNEELTYVHCLLEQDFWKTKWENDLLQSSCILLKTFAVDSVLCDSVLHFKLTDFEKNWNSETVTELYYAKHFGLVQFVQNSGDVYHRIWPD